MFNRNFGFWILIFGFLSNGCITLDSQKKQDEVAQMRSSVSNELSKVKDDVNSLKGRMDEIEYKINKLSETQRQQSKELNATLKEWQKEIRDNTEKRIKDTEQKIQALEKKQAQDKKELQDRTDIIVEEITKENKELHKELQTIKSASGARYTTTSEDYYVIAEGDTLSKISQRFGVTVKDIMEINSITDSNSIRIGQKLKIPQNE